MLIENTVQNSAQKFLENYYQGIFSKKRIFSQTEVRVKNKYGGKRADGLLVFKHWLWGTYVVSMEAKSSKTLPAMKPKFDAWFFIRNCLTSGLIICILSGSFFFFYKLEDTFLSIILPFNAFLIGTLIYGILTFTNYSHKVVPVVKQVFQYPANEKWLAFSRDSLDKMGETEFKHLRKICKARGVGILEVIKKDKTKILLKPTFRSNWGRGFLYFYGKEKEIKKAIH